MNKRGVSPRFSFNQKPIKKIVWIIVLITLWCIALKATGNTPKTLKIDPGEEFIPKVYISAHNSVLSDYGAFKKEVAIAMVRSKAIEHNIDTDLFLRIAKCESGFNQEAENPTSTASGIFQFLDSTFFAYAEAYGIGWTDKNDVETQAELAAEMIADGGLHHWNASRECWM